MAEVLAAPADGSRGRRGSGYLVAPGRVLTAAHVIAGAAGIRVRFEADRPGEQVVTAAVEWQHEGIDVAVLAIPDAGTGSAAATPYGRLGEHDAVVRCTAVGFPRFKLRTDRDGSSFRDAEHIQATCAALSNRREGTLDLSVDAPPAADPDPGRDSWEGMSGAAVFSDGRLIGMVSRHHLADGPGRIAAGRVDRWAETLTPNELTSLETAVQGELRPHALPDVLPTPPRDLLQASYRAQLADFAPQELVDRKSELAALVDFCGGTEPYLWVQGPPWAGKTALTAWFALHPPRGVVPVWFFVTARYAGQADSGAYAEAVIDQLAAVAGQEPVSRDASPARNGERSLLLRRAAERVRREGGTLVLIVDGLDEDQSLTPGGTGPSIASVLPERLPPGVRVLVTSRPGPGVPADVRGGHPLRACPVLNLAPNAAALHTEHEARHELRRALSGSRAERDLVGLLAAARGPLKVEDLRALTQEPEFTLRPLLDSGFGRILRLSGGSVDPPAEEAASSRTSGYGDEEMASLGDRGDEGTAFVGDRGDEGTASLGDRGYGDQETPDLRERGYVFSHQTLLAVAQQEFGQDLAPYLERLHAWAAGYAEAGWPADTPGYLLQPYGRMAASPQSPEGIRLAVRLVTDPRRHARLHAHTESDAACLAEIAAVHETVRGLGADDLEALAALAVAGDLVARRNEELHLDVPAAYGQLGKVRLAVGLARSVFHPLNRGIALAKLARVLSRAGERRAVSLAQEAVGLVEGELTGRDAEAALDSWWNAKGVHAAVLAGAGRREDAVRLLSELPRPVNFNDVSGYTRALALAAGAVRDAEALSGLLRAAEEALGDRGFAPSRAHLLADLAQAWADCDAPGERDRLHDALLAWVDQHPRDLRLLPIAAEALRTARPEVARALTLRALAAWDDPRGQGGIGGASGAVYALVAAGGMEEARRLASRREPDVASAGWVDQMSEWGSISRTLAMGWAREGETAAAWRSLAPSWSSDTLDIYAGGSAGTVAGLLAESGRSEEAEAWLATEPGVPRKIAAEALSALAVHHAADDPERALGLLHRAVNGFPGARWTLSLYQQDQFADLAGAMASSGCVDEAERLVAALPDTAVRTRGWAAVSLAVQPADSQRALRLAECAVSTLSEVESVGRTPGVFTAAVQALARAGAVQRVPEVIETYATKLSPVSDDIPHARIHALALLWPHSPSVAGHLADLALSEVAEHAVDDAIIAALLVSIGRHDEQRATAVREVLDGRSRGTYRFHADPHQREWARMRRSFPHWVDIMVAGFLELGDDPEYAVRAYLDPFAAEHRGEVLPASRAGTAALAYAALGDHAAALQQARQARNEVERSEVLAHLAAYAACLPTGSAAVPLYEDRYDVLPLFRGLATQLLPPPSGPDLIRARALLAQALTPAGWHHALPVLAHLAPAAVRRAGRSVLLETEGPGFTLR
ncbi:trypsin-like peptidase domain-containing protein [Streptomyces sp. N35]|uniref:trypsin-like peptidase domain-containing protein n=1 Tax=Streptomyces sp. N35 TaxID=2795730 RepID=UPI0018F40533|nr:trypsin-like peptidase domain-containing protein [Streptomyces sp. N35]